jgi:hypothetical protein
MAAGDSETVQASAVRYGYALTASSLLTSSFFRELGFD